MSVWVVCVAIMDTVVASVEVADLRLAAVAAEVIAAAVTTVVVVDGDQYHSRWRESTRSCVDTISYVREKLRVCLSVGEVLFVPIIGRACERGRLQRFCHSIDGMAMMDELVYSKVITCSFVGVYRLSFPL